MVRWEKEAIEFPEVSEPVIVMCETMNSKEILSQIRW